MIFRTFVGKSYEITEGEILERLKKIKSKDKPTFEEVAALIAREKLIKFLDEHSSWLHRGIVPIGEPFSDNKTFEGVETRVSLVEEKFKEVPF
jgi:hypothetical protein